MTGKNPDAGHVVAHAAALEGRRVAGTGQQMRHAGMSPERRDVVGGPIGIGSGHAVPGDRPVDQTRIVGSHRCVVEPKA